MDLAVMDPLPLFRLGALAALGGGRELSSTEDLTAWLSQARSAIVLLTLTGDDEEQGWSLIASLHQYPGLRPVALLSPFTVTSAARALRAGAVHVVPRDAAPAALRQVIEEVVGGVVTLSLDVLRAATVQPRPPRSGPAPTDDEIGWLRALGQGSTVASLADASGLSERVLYRRLNELYRRLGVPNRTQALILGRDEGWL
jgi:DNA-binding NarL/FixJ family response regulator